MKVRLWNGKTAPRVGIGTWVMGGEQYWDGAPTGWSGVDDAESLAALHAAFECGVRIIDTADQYGGGHAEALIGQAIADSAVPRHEFILCTKVGMVCDPKTRNIVGVTSDETTIFEAINASLVRVGVDHLDLVKFHLNGFPPDQSQPAFDAFSKAFEQGKIGGFGWSTDDVDGAKHFADRPGFVAVQHDLNLFTPAKAMLDVTESRGLWSFCRQPLAMGLLTGKYLKHEARFDSRDIRGGAADWMRYFDKTGAPSASLVARLERLRGALTRDGRSLAQGALGWCLAQSGKTIPIPGCRTVAQVQDNFGVIDQGPLPQEAVEEIAAIIEDEGPS